MNPIDIYSQFLLISRYILYYLLNNFNPFFTISFPLNLYYKTIIIMDSIKLFNFLNELINFYSFTSDCLNIITRRLKQEHSQYIHF